MIPYPTLAEATRVWACVALLSFGGPAGQIAIMHRTLVEEKRWLGDGRFLHALNFCMLLPGPEAQQLATYVGWLLHGTRGALIAGILFVLPGVVVIMGLSWLYVLFGQLGPIAAAFVGLKAAVLAIVLEAVVRIGRRTLRNPTLRAIALLAFIAIFAFAAPFPLIVLAAAVIGFLGQRAGLAAFAPGAGHGPAGAYVPDAETLLGEEPTTVPAPTRRAALRAGLAALALWLVPVALLLALPPPGNVIAGIATVVSRMAETTPGPLIMVLQFVGFLAAFREAGWEAALLAGTLGGLLATWVTFAPCFAWIFLGAPFIEDLRGNRALSAALTAVTAAVVGVILNLAVWFAIHTVFAATTLVDAGPLALELPVLASIRSVPAALSLLALVAVFRWKLGLPAVLAGGAALGLALWAAGVI
jgi:chromate transporter